MLRTINVPLSIHMGNRHRRSQLPSSNIVLSPIADQTKKMAQVRYGLRNGRWFLQILIGPEGGLEEEIKTDSTQQQGREDAELN